MGRVRCAARGETDDATAAEPRDRRVAPPGALDAKEGGSDVNLDIDGYLTSTEFLAQFAAFVAAIFNLLFQSVLGGVLGGS